MEQLLLSRRPRLNEMALSRMGPHSRGTAEKSFSAAAPRKADHDVGAVGGSVLLGLITAAVWSNS